LGTKDKNPFGIRVISIVIFSIIVLGSVSTSQFAFSDGGGPIECEGSPTDVTGGTTTITENFIITAICIKSGNEAMDGMKHSGLIITDGTIDNCYVIEGLQTNEVTVSSNPDCKEVSHVDYFLGRFIGGSIIPIENNALLLAGAKLTAAWMIPVIVSAIGIGIILARKF